MYELWKVVAMSEGPDAELRMNFVACSQEPPVAAGYLKFHPEVLGAIVWDLEADTASEEVWRDGFEDARKRFHSWGGR